MYRMSMVCFAVWGRNRGVCYIVLGLFTALVRAVNAQSDKEYLILRNQFHYCEGESLLEAINGTMPENEVLERCSANRLCSFVTIGPESSGTAAGWFCSRDDWNQREHNGGWMVAVKGDALVVPGFTTSVNGRAAQCSTLGSPRRGFFTVESARLLCEADPRCASFSIFMGEEKDADKRRTYGSIRSILIFCSDVPTLSREEGWVTGVATAKLQEERESRDNKGRLVPGNGDLTGGDFLSGETDGTDGHGGIGQKGKFKRGIITRHQYWYPMPRPGVLYPT